MPFIPQSIALKGGFRVDLPPTEAFPLFSPLGEKAWVPEWNPELLHPSGVEWETGLVWRTAHDGQESIWFVGALDREQHDVTYYRVDLGLTGVTIAVSCRESDGGTAVAVRYTFVGITDAGNEFVRARTEAEFEAKMRHWQESIAAIVS